MPQTRQARAWHTDYRESKVHRDPDCYGLRKRTSDLIERAICARCDNNPSAENKVYCPMTYVDAIHSNQRCVAARGLRLQARDTCRLCWGSG